MNLTEKEEKELSSKNVRVRSLLACFCTGVAVLMATKIIEGTGDWFIGFILAFNIFGVAWFIYRAGDRD